MSISTPRHLYKNQSQELLIKSANFMTAEGETIELVNMNNDLKLHTLTLTFAAPLPVGPCACFDCVHHPPTLPHTHTT